VFTYRSNLNRQESADKYGKGNKEERPPESHNDKCKVKVHSKLKGTSCKWRKKRVAAFLGSRSVAS